MKEYSYFLIIQKEKATHAPLHKQPSLANFDNLNTKNTKVNKRSHELFTLSIILFVKLEYHDCELI